MSRVHGRVPRRSRGLPPGECPDTHNGMHYWALRWWPDDPGSYRCVLCQANGRDTSQPQCERCGACDAAMLRQRDGWTCAWSLDCCTCDDTGPHWRSLALAVAALDVAEWVDAHPPDCTHPGSCHCDTVGIWAHSLMDAIGHGDLTDYLRERGARCGAAELSAAWAVDRVKRVAARDAAGNRHCALPPLPRGVADAVADLTADLDLPPAAEALLTLATGEGPA